MMSNEWHWTPTEEAAEATALDVSILWRYAEVGLIQPSAAGYTADDLAELRRVRRLQQELELDHPAIEIILRMRRRILALQAEVRRLESAARATRARRRPQEWIEAEWDDLF